MIGDRKMAQRILTDDALTPPMLIGRIAKVHSCKLKLSDAAPIMQHNSCRLILLSLAHKENVTQLEIAQSTGLKPPTVSVALKKLEGDGYVTRVTDEDDMRAVRVSLSEKGRSLEAEAYEALDRIYSEMMAGFTDEEAETLRILLLKVKRNLDDMQGKLY